MMKIINILLTLVIIFSVYYISGRKKSALLLVALAPIMYYMAPWIGPIQIASLLFLWAFFFIEKYEYDGRIRYLFYSGLLMGGVVAFWNTGLLVLFIFILCFFYNKNINHLALFLFFAIIGMLPQLILDQSNYGFAFYGILKGLGAWVVSIKYGSIYSSATFTRGLMDYASFIVMMPIIAIGLFRKRIVNDNTRQIILMTLVTILLLGNPQIRYLLFIYPIILIMMSRSLSDGEIKIQQIIFAVLSLVVIVGYIMTSGHDASLINSEVRSIAVDYPNETFVVGNSPDSYVFPALFYWGNDVRSFVSLQDYKLFFDNSSELFEKKIVFTPRIGDRRQIWVGGGIDKADSSNINYSAIDFGVGVGEPINLTGFKFIKMYGNLYLSNRISS